MKPHPPVTKTRRCGRSRLGAAHVFLMIQDMPLLGYSPELFTRRMQARHSVVRSYAGQEQERQ